MFGISYGELFLLVGATAALVGIISLSLMVVYCVKVLGGRKNCDNSDLFVCLGPKDLPMIARTAGRLAGRAIGYVQLARGQLDNVMQQSQARQVPFFPTFSCLISAM